MKYVQPKVFDITKQRPAVLLVGNGLNRCMGDTNTWLNAILRLTKDDGILDSDKDMNYSIRATVTTDENENDRWRKYEELFGKEFKYINDNSLLKNLLQIPFDAILTTNYTYELENALDPDYVSSNNKKDYAYTTAAGYTPVEKQPDTVRLLNTFNRFPNGSRDVNIWHIHGEVREPCSMILTHEEYGRLVYELVANEQDKPNSNIISFRSWIDYFIYGDLYVLGQGIDFAEFDLWWLLSRRHREGERAGKAIFYNPQLFNNRFTKEEDALDQIGFTIQNCGVHLLNSDTFSSEENNKVYFNFYDKAIAQINEKIKNPIPKETEILLDCIDKVNKKWSKSNMLRLLYKLAITKILVLEIKGHDGSYAPYRNRKVTIYTMRRDYTKELNNEENLIEMTGLDALILSESTSFPGILSISPTQSTEGLIIPKKISQYMLSGIDKLKILAEEAESKEKAQRKNNVNKASEATHYISAFISNNTFPSSISEAMDDLRCDGYFNYEKILHEDEVNWTSPKWAKPGDIVFFALAQSARSKITKLLTEIKNKKRGYLYEKLKRELERALKEYEKLGRNIFAIGQVCEPTEELSPDDPFYMTPPEAHWNNDKYSCIINIFQLKHPVSIDDYKDFVALNKFGGITKVTGDKFTRLQNLIIEKNKDMNLPQYFLKSTAAPVELSDLQNGKWMQLTNKIRNNFNSKDHYQSFYTDYLLKSIGDNKQFWTRCRYRKINSEDAFMDNVILFGKRYLPVKIFPVITDTDKAIIAMNKYCYASKITISKDTIAELPQIYSDKVLGIDLNHIFIYDADTKKIHLVQSLDDLKSTDDISSLKQRITAELDVKIINANEKNKRSLAINSQTLEQVDSIPKDLEKAPESLYDFTTLNSDPIPPVSDISESQPPYERHHENGQTEQTPKVPITESEKIQRSDKQKSADYSALSQILQDAGVEAIDKRKAGGALWVIGGQELKSVISQCEKLGVKFFYKPGGGKVSKNRDAWWTKDQES